MMGNIKGVTLKEIKQLKALAVRGAEAEQTVKQQVNTIELQEGADHFAGAAAAAIHTEAAEGGAGAV